MKVTLKLPLNFTSLTNEHQAYFCNSFEYKPQRVRKIKNAFVTNNGIVLNGLNYVKESCYEPKSYRRKYWFYALKRKLLSKVSKWGKQHLFIYEQIDPVGIIHQPFFNYFHFTIESLTRWIILTKEFPSSKILIPDELIRIPYVHQWLDLLKINFIKVPESNNIKVNQLLVPTIVRWAGNHDATILKELRKRTLDALSKHKDLKEKGPSKIFIVRNGRRQIKNIAEIKSSLKEYGITFIDFDGMSVIEQVNIVRDAELIIGQHGAGLTNVIFAKENCTIVEIFIDPKDVNGVFDDEYYRIFNQLDFNYYCIFSNICSNNDDFYTSDSILSIKILNDMIQEILKDNNF
jgi:hypothetical protein